jgi:phosphate transport system protein
VISFDDQVDARYMQIEEGVQSLLARQTPVAADLRLVLAVLRVNLHLERMADYCVTVAKLTKLMGNLNVTDEAISRSIEDMGQRAEQMIRVALDAFATRDAKKAETLVDLDELIDRANRNATEDVLSLGDSPEEREYGLRMLVVSRCVERIGDHAVDIGEQVVYLVTGEFREFSDASHPAEL